MLGFLFGKKKRRNVRRSTKRKGSRKPPARLIKMCKRYRIKCTKKVGNRRVYKKVSVLKKQLKRKLKNRKVRNIKVRSIRHYNRFGEFQGTTGKEKIYTPIEILKQEISAVEWEIERTDLTIERDYKPEIGRLEILISDLEKMNDEEFNKEFDENQQSIIKKYIFPLKYETEFKIKIPFNYINYLSSKKSEIFDKNTGRYKYICNRINIINVLNNIIQQLKERIMKLEKYKEEQRKILSDLKTKLAIENSYILYPR